MITIHSAAPGSLYQSGEATPMKLSSAEVIPKLGSNTNSQSRPTATPDST